MFRVPPIFPTLLGLVTALVLTAPAQSDQTTVAKQDVPNGAYRTLRWEDLVPKGWSAVKLMREQLGPVSNIREGSLDEADKIQIMRKIWDSAPTRADLQNARIRLPGYVVPLEPDREAIKEFLLVPYFGACIHSPPPPANQIVHVTLNQPKALSTMDVIWVSGQLLSQRRDTDWGISGYELRGHLVEPYQTPEH